MIDIESNKQEIIRLLNSVNREGMPKLIRAMEKSDFFIAPASTIYHLNCKGGLAYHSLSKYRTLKKLCEIFGITLPIDSIIIVGLLHDLCKIFTYAWDNVNKKYYKKKLSSNKHGLKSIKRINQFMKLTNKEYDMIRWHMNHYSWDGDFKAEEDRLRRECPEAYLAYFADHISTLFLEG